MFLQHASGLCQNSLYQFSAFPRLLSPTSLRSESRDTPLAPSEVISIVELDHALHLCLSYDVAGAWPTSRYVRFCLFSSSLLLVWRRYHETATHSVQCRPLSDQYVASVQRRCPSGALRRVNNLRAAHSFRGEDHVCTGNNLHTPNDLRTESLCHAVSCMRSQDNVCSKEPGVPVSGSCTSDHLPSTDNLCVSHYLCSGGRSEVGCGSEVIPTRGHKR